MTISSGHASIVNQVFSKFLSRLPHSRSDLVASKMPISERMSYALETLAELMGDSSISSRDPLSSMSFSCLSPQVIKGQTEALETYRKGALTAFSPVGEDGRPHRKYVV